MKSLKWLFELVDRTSGPAKAMRRELSSVEKQMKDLDRLARKMRMSGAGISDSGRNELRRIGGQRRALADQRAELQEQAAALARPGGRSGLGGLASIGLGMAMAGATMAATAVGTVGMAFARSTVQAATFRENALVSLRTVLGSQEEAMAVFRESQQMALETPLETQQVVDTRLRFVLGGYSRETSLILTRAAADVGAALGEDRIEPFMHALMRVRASGRLGGDALHMLQAANINRGTVFGDIARQLGLRTSSQADMMGQVTRAISEGRVSAEVAQQAIVRAVETDISHGAAGSLSRNLSGTVAGRISNFRSAFSDLLQSGGEGQGLEETPGMRSFKGFLRGVADLMNPTAAGAQRLRSALFGLTNALFGGLFGDLGDSAGAQRMQGWLETFTTKIEEVTPSVRNLAANLRGMGEGFGESFSPVLSMLSTFNREGDSAGATGRTLGQIFGILAVVLGALAMALYFAYVAAVAVGTTLGWLAGVVRALVTGQDFVSLGDAIRSNLGESGQQLGAGLANGMAAGIQAASGNASAAARDMAEGATASAQQALDAHSPSRVFARLGRWSAEGYASGIDASLGDVGEAVDAMASPRLSVTAAGLASGGRAVSVGSITVQPNVHIPVGSDPQAMQEASRAGTVEALTEVFEDLALQAA